MPKLVIIGAGLTGLSLAYHLSINNYDDYEIFEKNLSPGGLLETVSEKGFTFDHTGHFLHISDFGFREFLDKIYGISNFNELSRQSFIYAFDRFIPYPFQQNIQFLPQDVAFECLEGFIRRAKKIQNPKNFQEWVVKYFGAGFGKHFFFPYNSKLLNLDVKKIMPSWTSRFVPSTTLRNLFDSLQGSSLGENVGYNAKFYYPKEGGIFSLIKKLCLNINKNVQICHKVIRIDPVRKVVIFQNGSVVDYDILVTTAPLPETLKMICGESFNFQVPIKKLKCNSVFNFNVGVAKDNLSEKHWVYLPENKFLAYRVGFWHNFAQNMVPEGHSSFYGEVSCLVDKKSSAEIQDLGSLALNQLIDFFGLKQSDIVLRKDLFLKYAYVVYDAWREKNLSSVLQRLSKENIYSIGRFGEWKYSSMQEAFLDGKIMAEKLLENLDEFKQKKSSKVMISF